MNNLHHKGDPISFYPTMNVKWLRNEVHRAKEALRRAQFRLREAGREYREGGASHPMTVWEKQRARSQARRERENLRRARCELERRFAIQVEEEGEATQAGLYQA